MKKTKKGNRNSVQELLGIQRFTRYGLLTDLGELVFFRVAPTNISVLSRVNMSSAVYTTNTAVNMARTVFRPRAA